MNKNEFYRGPERKTYYDMNPWYLKNKEKEINDWHQQIKEVNDFLLKEIKSLIKKNNIKRVLEIACGGGGFTLKYAGSDFSLDAFEYSSVAVEMAKKKDNFFKVNFFEGDAINSDSYKDNYYDLIIAKDFLHCLIGEDRHNFFALVNRSLKSNGNFLLSTHGNLPEKYENIMETIDLKSRINCLHTRIYLDREDIEKEFQKDRFEIVMKKEFEKYYAFIYLLKKNNV